jgi:cysteine desulfurase
MSTVLKTPKEKTNSFPVYLDCNATTPMEPRVQELVMTFMADEFGNSGSRTHEYGNRAKVAVQRARDQVAGLLKCQREEVIFTSGATESNNLALLGLRAHGEKTGRKHIIATAVEHKAILEPLEFLTASGFDVTLVAPDQDGAISAKNIQEALRSDTLLVSVMHVNNETGVIQPLSEIATALEGHSAFFHVDAAQGFGKRIEDLQNQRIELISVSGHKIYGPKGVGALVIRRRGFERVPLAALCFGGGQERGLRPGTLAVPLIVGLGEASAIAQREMPDREKRVRKIREEALRSFLRIGGVPNGDQERVLPSTLNISFPGLDSEAVMLALKHDVAISNGSACTSQNYTPSHVLGAMNLPPARIASALRFSWCHLTPDVDWESIAVKIRALG